jgi:hypothetical protein
VPLANRKFTPLDGEHRLDWVIRGILADLPEPAPWFEVRNRLSVSDREEIESLVGSQEATAVLMYLRRMVERRLAEEPKQGKFARTFG